MKASITKLEQEITQVGGRMTVLVGQQNQFRYSRERLLEEGSMLSNSKEKLKERIGELSSPLRNGITREEEQMIAKLGKEIERRHKD